MKNTTDITTGLLAIGVSVIGAIGVWMTDVSADESMQLGPTAFTKAVLLIMFILGCAQTVIGFRLGHPGTYWPEKRVLKKVAAITLLFLGYCLLVAYLVPIFRSTGIDFLASNMSFWFASFLFLVSALLLGGRRNIWEILLVSTVLPAVIIVIFSKFFLIALP